MPPVGEVTVTPLPLAYRLLTAGRRSASISQDILGPDLGPDLDPNQRRGVDKDRYSRARLLWWALNPPPARELHGLFEYGGSCAEAWMEARVRARATPLDQEEDHPLPP